MTKQKERDKALDDKDKAPAKSNNNQPNKGTPVNNNRPNPPSDFIPPKRKREDEEEETTEDTDEKKVPDYGGELGLGEDYEGPKYWKGKVPGWENRRYRRIDAKGNLREETVIGINSYSKVLKTPEQLLAEQEAKRKAAEQERLALNNKNDDKEDKNTPVTLAANNPNLKDKGDNSGNDDGVEGDADDGNKSDPVVVAGGGDNETGTGGEEEGEGEEEIKEEIKEEPKDKRKGKWKERFSKAGREAVKFARGFAKGVWLGLKDMVKDSWEMIKNPGKIVKGTIDMLRKPIKTFKAMLNFGKELAKEFIGGDSEKKGEMIGKVSAEIIVDVAITKGIGKLKQLKHVNKIAGKIKDAIKKSPPMVAMAPLIKKGKKARKVVDKADDVPKKTKVKFGEDNRKYLLDMDNIGGHVVEKHINKSNQFLINRAMSEGVDATTFYNKFTGTRAVKENLKNNTKEILEWLNSTNPKDRRKVFDFVHSYDIGKGVKKNTKKIKDKINTSRVVLKKCKDAPEGFIVLTGFPVIR